MLLSMAKVQIIGTKACLDKSTQHLQRLGMIQIEEWKEIRSVSQQRMALNEKAVHLRERLAYALTRVESVLAALPAIDCSPLPQYEYYYSRPNDWLLYMAETDLEEIGPQTQTLATRYDRLNEQLSSLARYEVTLQQLLPLVPALVDLEHFVVTAVWVERHYQPVLELISHQLEELTEGLSEIISREVDQDILAAVLVFPKSQTKAVNTLLGQESIAQLRLPTEFVGQPLETALSNIRQRLKTIPNELARIEAEQLALAQRWRPRLLTWQTLLRDHLAQIDIQTHFGQTDHTFVIEGWVPENRLAELESTLEHEVGDTVVISVLPVSRDEKKEAPIMFDNPALVKPFEPLVALLALPKYDAFDPTPLMFLFLPLFFGMILGDVAYGLILLLLMLFLRIRFKTRPIIRSLTEVLIIGSVWSIIFGFLFGEFLGTLGERLGMHPLWFDRGHNVQAIFLLTIGIGAGHIVLGLCLGVSEAIRKHSRHELMEKASTLVSLVAIFLLIAVLSDYLPDTFFTPAIALLVIGVAILIYSLGKIGIFLGPLELFGTLGNILSYLRIAAIGLSSVYLAQVANELADISGNLLLGLIIAGLFHALNIALGTFSPTIHSLRLHYVEFFSKFYQGGGQAFHPFRRSINRP